MSSATLGSDLCNPNSRKRPLDFSIHSSHRDFSLRRVTLQLFVLRQLNRSGGLIFARATRNGLLHGIAQIH